MRFVLATLGLGGCGFSCTDMWAPSHVLVELEGDQPPGLYEIELDGFGQRALCAVTLPHAEDDPVICTSNATLELDPAGERILALSVTEFDPPSFVVEVLRDGALLADGRFVPEYVVDEPNGQGCGERSVATVAMSIDP